MSNEHSGKVKIYLEIDIGTSGVKVVIVDENLAIVSEETETLTTFRPHLLWSEQDPEDWWRVTCTALNRIRSTEPSRYAAVKAIGIVGQMHGATLLDADNMPLRLAILWQMILVFQSLYR